MWIITNSPHTRYGDEPFCWRYSSTFSALARVRIWRFPSLVDVQRHIQMMASQGDRAEPHGDHTVLVVPPAVLHRIGQMANMSRRCKLCFGCTPRDLLISLLQSSFVHLLQHTFGKINRPPIRIAGVSTSFRSDRCCSTAATLCCGITGARYLAAGRDGFSSLN